MDEEVAANEPMSHRHRNQSMEHTDVQVLLRKFAAPLADYAATSAARKDLAEMLVRNLWMAMIASPEMEQEAWRIFQASGKLDDESLQPIKQVYYEQMRPVVSEDELAELRRRYQLRPKS